MYSKADVEDDIWLKMSLMASISMPGLSCVPRIVNVLPLPVCPYAKMVPLIPSSADFTTFLTLSLYTPEVTLESL